MHEKIAWPSKEILQLNFLPTPHQIKPGKFPNYFRNNMGLVSPNLLKLVEHDTRPQAHTREQIYCLCSNFSS